MKEERERERESALGYVTKKTPKQSIICIVLDAIFSGGLCCGEEEHSRCKHNTLMYGQRTNYVTMYTRFFTRHTSQDNADHTFHTDTCARGAVRAHSLDRKKKDRAAASHLISSHLISSCTASSRFLLTQGSRIQIGMCLPARLGDCALRRADLFPPCRCTHADAQTSVHVYCKIHTGEQCILLL